jgi:hypothetical protein
VSVPGGDMKKLLSAIKGAVRRPEMLSDATLLVLTQAAQDASLAGNEIDAAHRLVGLVVKARRDASVIGKDTIADSALTAAIERARAHQKTATQRLEKAAADFAVIAPVAVKDRRGELLVQKLRDGQRRLAELGQLLVKQPAMKPKRQASKKKKRWTIKTILTKARAAGLRVTKSRKDNHFAVWNRVGGIDLWENGTATRADVSAGLAKKMTLREAAEFLFPNERSR